LHVFNLSNLSPFVNLSGRQKFSSPQTPLQFLPAGQSREAGLGVESGSACAPAQHQDRKKFIP